MDFVTELTAGIVVDRAGLNKLKTVDMAATLADIYSKGKQVHLVDNVKQFLGTPSLIRALEDNSPALPLILEARGVELNEDDIDIVRQFSEVKQHVLDRIAALTPPPPPYPFVDVPEGWSVDTHIKFQAKQLKRAKGNTDYSIGYKTLERIWEQASAVWAGSSKDRRLNGVQAGGYWRDVHINDNYLEIGCQKVQRYEIEQVALARGWAIPEVIVED